MGRIYKFPFNQDFNDSFPQGPVLALKLAVLFILVLPDESFDMLFSDLDRHSRVFAEILAASSGS